MPLSAIHQRVAVASFGAAQRLVSAMLCRVNAELNARGLSRIRALKNPLTQVSVATAVDCSKGLVSKWNAVDLQTGDFSTHPGPGRRRKITGAHAAYVETQAKLSKLFSTFSYLYFYEGGQGSASKQSPRVLSDVGRKSPHPQSIAI